jgi:hypothetical protein
MRGVERKTLAVLGVFVGEREWGGEARAGGRKKSGLACEVNEVQKTWDRVQIHELSL